MLLRGSIEYRQSGQSVINRRLLDRYTHRVNKSINNGLLSGTERGVTAATVIGELVGVSEAFDIL
jgi:hypothetical protein